MPPASPDCPHARTPALVAGTQSVVTAPRVASALYTVTLVHLARGARLVCTRASGLVAGIYGGRKRLAVLKEVL